MELMQTYYIRRLTTFVLVISVLFLGACIKPMKGFGGGDKKGKTRTHKRKNFKKLSSKNNHDKLHTKTLKQWSFMDLFRNEQKQRELKCPDKRKEKENEKGRFKEPSDELADAGASIKRFTRSIHFDIIELEEAHLEIPAFKQFKNNMTDFTRDGEEQFKFIIQEIRSYLGDNTNGNGVTLKIIGSASQIPTSFDPSKPNNNINADGSSISGRTSIANNKKLAQARALELAKKIQLVFKEISIVTPTLEEIELGATAWDAAAQTRLNDAAIRNDEAGIQEVFTPFQKEQYVKVESQESYMKTVKPEAIAMYMVSVRPRIIYDIENGKEKTISSFIVSKATYNKIGGTLRFDSQEERDAYLKSNKLSKIYDTKHQQKRWFLYGNQEELEALEIEGDYDRIFRMYELGMVDERDKEVLKKIIRHKYLKSNKVSALRN